MMTHIMIIYVVNKILHLIYIILIDIIYFNMMLLVGNILCRATVAPSGCRYIIGVPFAAALANLTTTMSGKGLNAHENRVMPIMRNIGKRAVP